MAEYKAYPYGKMNQSFMIKDENNQSVYEANLLKFRLFGAHDFEIVNNLLGTKTLHKVGKTFTVEHGSGGISFASASYFKFDKKNVFDILEKNGYSFSIVKIEILHPEFALIDQNKEIVATYKMNVKGERQEGVRGIGHSQRNIVITTDQEDLDIIFFGAFILSRVDFSAYLM